jgi:type IV secretory pathway TrbD component
MTTYYWLKVSLTFHLIGFTIAAGTTLTSFVMKRRLWNLLCYHQQKALPVLASLAVFPILTGSGIGMLLLSGFAMVYLIFAGQLWFKIKLGLVLLALLNGLFITRPLNRKINQLAMSGIDGSDKQYQFTGLERKSYAFYLSQLLVFLVASFRFT